MTFDQLLQRFTPELTAGSMIAFGVAIVAGILSSAVCPCTVPVGLGMAGVAGASETQTHRTGFIIAAAFFAGIVLNLTLLGTVASRLGVILTESFGRYWTLVMAAFSFIAGIAAFWGPRLRADQLSALRQPGISGAFIYGFVFSLGTSAAPLLVLLTFAASQGGNLKGVLLSFAFGVGRGLPFLVAGLLAGTITRFARLGPRRKAIQFVSGIALLFVSAYYTRAFIGLL